MRISELCSIIAFYGFAPIIIGLFFGNMILVYAGLVPIVFVILSLVFEPVQGIEVTGGEKIQKVFVEDTVKITRTIRASKGLGLLLIYEKLPEHFELVEGKNVTVLVKMFQPVEERMEYTIKCTRRGLYPLGEIDYSVRHPVGTMNPEQGKVNLGETLIVEPRYFKIRRVPERQQRSILPTPAESLIKMGVPTTNFRELREYNYGDSFRSINWKATARSIQVSGVPTVNEFEREGRRVVWIFLNSGKRMELGTSIENGFEYAIQAALSFAEFYLDRQCLVGFSIYNEDRGLQHFTYSREYLRSLYQSQGVKTLPDLLPVGPRASESGDPKLVYFNLYPDGGRKQFLKIQRILQSARIGMSDFNLAQSLQLVKGHMKSTNPLLILITNVTEESAVKLKDDLNNAERFITRIRVPRKNLLLVNVSGYGLAAESVEEQDAAKVMAIKERSLLRKVAPSGAIILNWDPSSKSLVDQLISRVKSR